MTRFLKPLILLFCLGLAACTTVDTVTPEQQQIARLRSELNSARSDTRNLLNQMEDLSARCSSLESDNASLRSSLSQLQSLARDASSRSEKAQQGVAELSRSASKNEDIAALNKAYQQLVSQMKSINESTLESQRRVDKNLQVIQGDAKTLQNYIQENRNRLASLESRMSGAEKSARSASSSSSSSSSASSSAQKIVRTGKPSAANISYDSMYEHVVAAGESLWMIAKDYGVSVTDIYNVNPNMKSSSLVVGQKIMVPKRTDQ